MRPPSIGFYLPTGADLDALRRIGTLADAAGFESVWTSDHIVAPCRVDSAYPYAANREFAGDPLTDRLDPLVAISVMASVTRRVRLGVSVLVVPYRHPAAVAKALASIDVVSGGRLSVGLGVGWMSEEFAALGIGFADRGRRTDEAIDVVRRLWSGDPVAHHGEFFDFDEIVCRPRPVQSPGPPISIGGHSAAAYRRIVSHEASGYHIVVDSATCAYGRSGTLSANLREMRDTVEAAGRDPDTVEVSAVILNGSVDTVGADLDEYMRCGVRRLILVAPTSQRTIDGFVSVVEAIAADPRFGVEAVNS